MFEEIADTFRNNQEMIEKVKSQWIKECERETKISQDLWKNREEWYKEQELNSTNSEWLNTNQNLTNNTAGNSNHFRRPNQETASQDTSETVIAENLNNLDNLSTLTRISVANSVHQRKDS